MNQRFLTLAEVAETLNITLSAARSLVNSGELPAIQLGGKRMWRVEESVLEEFIQEQYAESRARLDALSQFQQAGRNNSFCPPFYALFRVNARNVCMGWACRGLWVNARKLCMTDGSTVLARPRRF